MYLLENKRTGLNHFQWCDTEGGSKLILIMSTFLVKTELKPLLFSLMQLFLSTKKRKTHRYDKT